MSDLASQHCRACSGAEPALGPEEIGRLRPQLGEGWRVVDDHHLERTYKFPNFRKALDFVVCAGEMSEAEGHHPDLALSWGKVEAVVWTHKVGGLTENDFIWAAKADRCASA